ncbi:MAG: hypothetical protein FWD77_00790 [Betaproteobacteria bacterium]|nr:hypothetical protein [Betaproteobacteria bacterium]
MSSFPLEPPAFSGTSRAAPAGNALSWIEEGWALFTAQPKNWLLLALILLLIQLAMSVIPFGSLIGAVIGPILAGGLMGGCRRQSVEEAIEVSDLFAGFKHESRPLLLLGILNAGVVMAVSIVFLMIVGVGIAGALFSQPLPDSNNLLPFLAEIVPASLGAFFVALCFATLGLGLLLMAMLFSPALVCLNRMPPLAAARASFAACLKNWLPLTLYGLILLPLFLLALLTIGLGLLIVLPLTYASIYAAYRDIFVVS